MNKMIGYALIAGSDLARLHDAKVEVESDRVVTVPMIFLPQSEDLNEVKKKLHMAIDNFLDALEREKK